MQSVLDTKHVGNASCNASLAELKSLAVKFLPPTSILRTLILSEPDNLPRDEAVTKIGVFLKLLYQELAEGCAVKAAYIN